MSVVLITGASTGIGNLTAKKLARDGHTVFASMRGIDRRNVSITRQFEELAAAENLDLHVIELDVTSQDSADAAVEAVVDQAGHLDVVVQNAGHLYVATSRRSPTRT